MQQNLMLMVKCDKVKRGGNAATSADSEILNEKFTQG